MTNKVTVPKEVIETVVKASGVSQFAVIYGCDMAPLYNQVVLLLDKEVEAVSAGGIVLDEVAEPKACVGTVLAIGEGLYNNSGMRLPLTVKRFDRIRVKENFAETMTLNGTAYAVIRETDIMAILPS